MHFFIKNERMILGFIALFSISLLILIISLEPRMFLELLHPGSILYVDVANLDALYVERGRLLNNIIGQVLEGEKVSPCLLKEFIQIDRQLDTSMCECIINNTYVICEKKV
jgi:hypothetical protein